MELQNHVLMLFLTESPSGLLTQHLLYRKLVSNVEQQKPQKRAHLDRFCNWYGKVLKIYNIFYLFTLPLGKQNGSLDGTLRCSWIVTFDSEVHVLIYSSIHQKPRWIPMKNILQEPRAWLQNLRPHSKGGPHSASTTGLDEQSLSAGEEKEHRIRDSVLEHERGV